MAFVGQIIEIIQETPDVKTFRLERPADFSFIPGQFAIVSFVDRIDLPTEGKPLTFSSSPTEDQIDITVKEVGTFTKALLTLEVGDKLNIDGPRGRSLNFEKNTKEDIVFLAGGSGITPFMSILRYAVAKRLPNQFTLFFGNQAEKDIIYRNELDEMNKLPNIDVINVICDDENWQGVCGFIDIEKVLKQVIEPEKKIWYICGPPSMNKAMHDIMARLRIDESHIKFDKWEIPGMNN